MGRLYARGCYGPGHRRRASPLFPANGPLRFCYVVRYQGREVFRSTDEEESRKVLHDYRARIKGGRSFHVNLFCEKSRNQT